MSDLSLTYKDWITEKGTIPIKRILQYVEKDIISMCLTAAEFNVTNAALLLGISRTALSMKMQKHGINRFADPRKGKYEKARFPQ